MRWIRLGIVLGAWGLVAASLAGEARAADATIEEQVVGPVAENYGGITPYVVSPRGVRLATVAPKGSRVVVIVDGIAGPPFDEILPAVSYIDGRPLQEAQRLAVQAGRPPADASPRHVVFSRNGNRFAYVGRLGQEWVLMADGKELVRHPIAGATAVPGSFGLSQEDRRLAFTGDDGKHLFFSRTVFNGYECWVDGQRMPALHLGGAVGGAGDPIISPDGSRFAFVGTADNKPVVIVDGKDAGYFADQLFFTADSKRVIGVARSGNEHHVLMDGRPMITAQNIHAVYLAPAGERIISAASRQNPDGTRMSYLIVDGKDVEASACQTIAHVVISPDGKRYAAACAAANNVQFVVVDGKPAQHYDGIWQPDPTLKFSPDSSKLGYVAQSRGKFFVVIDGQESDGFDVIPTLAFSPDGKRAAYAGQRSLPPPGGTRMYVDGTAVPIDGADLGKLIFSPDGSRYAVAAGTHADVHLDGKDTGLRGDKFAFSPDGRHWAMWGTQPTADAKGGGVLEQFQRPLQQGLFVDGRHVYGVENNFGVRFRGFSPDSKHLYWLSFEPSSQPEIKPLENVVYLDGKPLVRFDRVDSGTVATGIYPGGNVLFQEAPPAWEVSSDGALTFLAPAADVIKRYKITPSPDTSIATMLADREAAEAKAQADAQRKIDEETAAKEKAMADQKAAQEKAIADAQAAREKAVADAKAAREKALADREKALAERKAAHEKSLAERKAAQEKAAAERAAKQAAGK